MKEEVINDIILFYRTIGALDEISERQLMTNKELNTINHAVYLDKLCEKYDIECELVAMLSEDIYEMEYKIDEKFRKILLNC